MFLMLCRLLIAWMVISVTRQVVQVGLCMGTTRAQHNRRVFSVERSASTREAGLSSVFSLGTKQFLQCTFLWYSLVGIYFPASRFLYILREAVSPLSMFLFQYLSFLFFKILLSACFSIPVS